MTTLLTYGRELAGRRVRGIARLAGCYIRAGVRCIHWRRRSTQSRLPHTAGLGGGPGAASCLGENQTPVGVGPRPAGRGGLLAGGGDWG